MRHPSFRSLRAQEDRVGSIERTPSQDRFFRAGKVGSWREALDDAQVRRVVERHCAQMERFGYLPRLASKPAGHFSSTTNRRSAG